MDLTFSLACVMKGTASLYITARHIMSHHVTPCHIMSHHVTSCHCDFQTWKMHMFKLLDSVLVRLLPMDLPSF